MFYLTTLSFAKVIQLRGQKKGRGIRNIGEMRLRAKPKLLGEKPLIPSLFPPQIPHIPNLWWKRGTGTAVPQGTCYRSVIISNFTYMATFYPFYSLLSC
jgi:hypothetical protein